jgi:hypothetical protein
LLATMERVKRPRTAQWRQLASLQWDQMVQVAALTMTSVKAVLITVIQKKRVRTQRDHTPVVLSMIHSVSVTVMLMTAILLLHVPQSSPMAKLVIPAPAVLGIKEAVKFVSTRTSVPSVYMIAPLIKFALIWMAISVALASRIH